MDAQAIRIVRTHVQYKNVWAAYGPQKQTSDLAFMTLLRMVSVGLDDDKP